MELSVVFTLSDSKIEELSPKLEIPLGGLVRFHPEKPILAIAAGECDGSKLVLYNVETGENKEIPLSGELRGLDISEDLVAVAGPEIGIRLYDLELKERLRIEDLPLGTMTSRVKFAKEGLLASSNEGVHYFSLSGDLIREKEIVEVQAIDSYGFLLAAASGRDIYVFDLEGKERRKYSLEDYVYSLKLVHNTVYAGSDGLYKEKEKIVSGKYVEDIATHHSYIAIAVTQDKELKILKHDRLEKRIKIEAFSVSFHPLIPLLAVGSRCGKTTVFEVRGSYRPVKKKKYVLRLENGPRKYRGISLERRLVYLGLLFYNAPVEALRLAAREGILDYLLRTLKDEGLIEQRDAYTFYSLLEPETLRGLERAVFEAEDVEEILREELEEPLKKLKASIKEIKEAYERILSIVGDEDVAKAALDRVLEEKRVRRIIEEELFIE